MPETGKSGGTTISSKTKSTAVSSGTPVKPMKSESCRLISGESPTSVVILKPAWASFVTPFPPVQEKCCKCGQLVRFSDRIELLGKVFHESCFRCAVCNRPLSNSEAIFHSNAWNCEAHASSYPRLYAS
uniref:LIM zinc-binding domain-containing protein n=1 Tax=Echinococcus granulosus TaxID=6210 RepID=A0A068WID1_ECHGR|nr:hypothetical protein EgrG_000198800 [Echinococcus granulosus]